MMLSMKHLYLLILVLVATVAHTDMNHCCANLCGHLPAVAHTNIDHSHNNLWGDD